MDNFKQQKRAHPAKTESPYILNKTKEEVGTVQGNTEGILYSVEHYKYSNGMVNCAFGSWEDTNSCLKPDPEKDQDRNSPDFSGHRGSSHLFRHRCKTVTVILFLHLEDTGTLKFRNGTDA